MATKQSTIDFILDQLTKVSGISTRKMFGEYALYCDGKVVALVCDNNLYMKITEAGKKFLGDKYKEGFAYPGAKASMLIEGDLIEEKDWLARLVVITADSLPLPKPKIKKTKQ
ncbi:MAG: TfoX/Sxy family protein [Candidatus Falkowbacteria bacterium]|nr:TfoX/Sxy family protein [Candidatus Falkowbacteria bacterium]